MPGSRRTTLKLLAGLPALSAAGVLPWLRAAHAADAGVGNWPEKSISYIVPFTPGGSTDVVGRTIAQKLGEALGKPVVVENKPGAAGGGGGEFRREGQARWLYPVRRHDQHPRDQCQPLQEPAVRPGQGLRAGDPGCVPAQRADRQSRPSRRIRWRTWWRCCARIRPSATSRRPERARRPTLPARCLPT